MKVYINYEKGSNPVVLNAKILALARKIPTYHEYECVVFKVYTWTTFLRLMWHGFAIASKDSCGFAMKKRYFVQVQTDGGNLYQTEVWLDEQSGGVRYVSLY